MPTPVPNPVLTSVLTPLIILFVCLLLIGIALALAARPASHDRDAQLVEQVNTLLPQTQCAQCGHPGCRPYAQAIIQEGAPINRCPPGGEQTLQDLASLLGREIIPLDTSFGTPTAPQLALIDESRCIGCTLCIQACPVDAIVGASRLMHTVIADDCTGCELCLPPCPVDCIDLVPQPATLERWQWPNPN